jgi:hypothetical protein
MKLNKYELDYILKSVPEEIREDGLTCPAWGLIFEKKLFLKQFLLEYCWNVTFSCPNMDLKILLLDLLKKVNYAEEKDWHEV